MGSERRPGSMGLALLKMNFRIKMNIVPETMPDNNGLTNQEPTEIHSNTVVMLNKTTGIHRYETYIKIGVT